MKKIVTLMTAVFLTLSLAACGSEKAATDSTADATAPKPSVQEETAGTEPVADTTGTKTGNFEILIMDDKTAVVVFGGAAPTPDMDGTRWGVSFDKKYAIQCDVEDGFFDCATWKIEKKSMSRIAEMNFQIEDNALILYADFGNVEGFSFDSFKEVTLMIDESADGTFSYEPVTMAMADAVVEEITITASEIFKPSESSGSASSETPDAPTIGEDPINDTPTIPANQYVGVYDSSKGTLVVTADTITVTFDGTEYTTDYAPEDITDENGIGKFTYTANGTEVQMFFGTDGEMVEVYVGRDGAGFTRSAADASAGSKASANADFSAMAGSYVNDRGVVVLNIKADGSFTYTVDSSSLKDTLSGQLPVGFKSGDKVQSGDYSIVFYFSDGSTNMSTDIKDAGNTMVGGDDLVKKS